MRTPRATILAAALAAGLTACTPGTTEDPAPRETVRPPQVQAFLDVALETMRLHGLYATDEEWPAVEQRAREQTAGATTVEQTYGPLRAALAEAGGPQSALETAQDLQAQEQVQPGARRAPTARSLGSGVAVLEVPAFRGPESAVARYVTAGHREIARLAPEATCGWVVDVAPNGGGDLWAMLGALLPLLDDGPLGAYDDRDGEQSPWVKDGATISVDGQVRARTPEALPEVPPGRLAVLQNGQTIAAGEGVVVALRAQPGSRSFGSPTFGDATGSDAFPLPGGAVLTLTTARMVGADGTVHDDPIEPDEEVRRGELAAAARWVREAEQC